MFSTVVDLWPSLLVFWVNQRCKAQAAMSLLLTETRPVLPSFAAQVGVSCLLKRKRSVLPE